MCYAVGTYGPAGITQTLVEKYDGTSWTHIASPNADVAQPNTLYGVTCLNATYCWAVGFYLKAGANYQTITEKWDGATWTLVASANNTALDNSLFGVNCVTTTLCYAVGDYFGAVNYLTLVELWNGTNWTVVASPNGYAPKHNELDGVYCLNASLCYAVGFNDTAASAYDTLGEKWDGTGWTIVATPNVSHGVQDNQLFGMTCADANYCVAVGRTSGAPNDAPLVVQL